jgi:hypothetical protein
MRIAATLLLIVEEGSGIDLMVKTSYVGTGREERPITEVEVKPE